MAMRRWIQLRPLISIGWLAIGTRPSNKPSDGLRARFPQYRYHDIVASEHRLVTEGLGIKHLRLVLGSSMGGMQTWMWGYMYPDLMLEPARPMASGMTMKYCAASSGWPAANSSLASDGSSQALPLALVPCRSSTALVMSPAALRTERRVVQLQLGELLAAREGEVLDDEVALALVRPAGLGEWLRGQARRGEQRDSCEASADGHRRSPVGARKFSVTVQESSSPVRCGCAKPARRHALPLGSAPLIC
jgi:pimeloyl-ACP methyl ester carboxylesterase